MNIEQKMAYLQKAIELGADIQVYFHDFSNNEEVEEAIAELNTVFQQKFEKKYRDNTHWVTSGDSEFRTTIFSFEEEETA